jgi:hypothetical protein
MISIHFPIDLAGNSIALCNVGIEAKGKGDAVNCYKCLRLMRCKYTVKRLKLHKAWPVSKRSSVRQNRKIRKLTT